MHRKDGRVTTPDTFTIFVSKQVGRIGVRIGSKRAYASVSDVWISPLAMPLRVVRRKDGLELSGEGVVRQIGDDTIAVTG